LLLIKNWLECWFMAEVLVVVFVYSELVGVFVDG
jgi:hypothetical protein